MIKAIKANFEFITGIVAMVSVTALSVDLMANGSSSIVIGLFNSVL